MIAARFKRTLIWLIPLLFVLLAIQYYQTGKIRGYAAAVMLVTLLVVHFASNALNYLWVRAFGASRAAVNGLAVLWAVLAICLFIFLYRMT
jgi:hypothetical protein